MLFILLCLVSSPPVLATQAFANMTFWLSGEKYSNIGESEESGALFSRQQLKCKPGFPIPCLAEGYCCPANSVCEPTAAAPIPFPCCPVGFPQCDGTGCCDPSSSFCCDESPTGCCIFISDNPDPDPTPTSSTSTTTESQTCTLPPLAEPQNTQPNPCAVPIPLVTKTVSLDYEDMLMPRKKEDKNNQQAIDKRKEQVDALFRSMCTGILTFGNVETETIVLTYNPNVKSKNRRLACGQISCNKGEQCDEFPFASTEEGGVAPGICIPALGNSIQGGFFSSELKSQNIQTGQKFVLRFDNINCKEFIGTGSSSTKLSLPRALANESQSPLEIGLTEQLQNLTVEGFGPFNADDNVLDHGLYPINELGPGMYTVSAAVNTGIVRSLSIIDSEGTEYASITRDLSNSSGAVPLTFNLTDPALITLMVDVTIGDNMDIRASLQQVTTSNATASPTNTSHPSPTVTAMSGEKGGPVLKGYIFSLCLVLLGYA